MRTLRALQPTVRSVAAVFLLSLIATTRCPAGVTIVGDVDPAVPAAWKDTFAARVGNTGAGVVFVNGGSELSSSNTYIGYGVGSGVVTVQGPGTALNSAYGQYVGYSGNGSLVVTNGATVTSRRGNIGFLAGSSGLVTVSGVGSSWNLTSDLSIGFAPYFVGEGEGVASGKLIIASGATVNAASKTNVWSGSGANGNIHFAGGTLNTGFLTAGGARLTGIGTINTDGLASDVDLVFNASRGLQQTFRLDKSPGQNITINLSVDETLPVYAGYKGAGSITIADGFELASGSAFIGYDGGSSGRATVRGAGSAWNLSRSLYVGGFYEGEVTGPSQGTLSISEGASVSGYSGFVGYNSGSSGRVSVQGAGSAWELASQAYVGLEGDGVVSISDGASASSTSTFIGYSPGSSGRVSVEAAGSEWNTNTLDVGYEGAGSLSISGGASVNVSARTTIAHGADSTGSIDFIGGVLNTGDLTAAAKELTGVGTINASGLVKSDVDLVFDSTRGLSQTVTLDDLPGQNITLNLTIDEADPIYTGYRGAGSMTVADGFQLSSVGGYLGYAVGSSGRVTVRGPDSSWSSASDLYVGYAGSGSLQISDGATVAVARSTVVAKEAGSTGRIHFDGGTLTTDYLSAAGAELTGQGTINTSGLASDVDLVFDASHGLEQTVVLDDLPGQNITLNLTLRESNSLYAGFRGSGSVTIAEGFALSTREGFIGYDQASSGQVMVEGAGSEWNSWGGIYVGLAGDGSLTISDGATVNGHSSSIGLGPESSGRVTVQGAGSEWNLDDRVAVGSQGHGSLVVSDGAKVRSEYGYVGFHTGSTGRAEIRGAGSAWDNDRTLSIGLFGDGELMISDAASVSSRTAEIGRSGRIAVESGSRLDLSDDLLLNSNRSRSLTLGHGASINVSGETVFDTDPGVAGVIHFEGGTLNTGSLLFSPAALSGAGFINTYGLIGDIDLHFDATRGSSQSLSINQLPGQDITLQLTVDGSQPIGVGYAGAGSLTIADGFKLASSDGNIGYKEGSSGQAVVQGAGSAWEIGDRLEVGRGGEGSLTISDGASVTNRYGIIGRIAGSSGRVTVRGVGSEWKSNNIDVGEGGNGSLSITEGATTSSNSAYVGSSSTSSGNAEVRGPGSAWSTNSLYVGWFGEGALTISDGGAVSTYAGEIGSREGSSGRVHVEGTDSTWTISDRLYVGRWGDGVLSISNGATVDVERSTVVADEDGSTGSIRFDGGTLNTGSLEAALTDLTGSGTINTGALISDVDLVFDATRGLNQTLLLNELPDQDITVNLSYNGSALYAGYATTGSLTVADGSQLASGHSNIGYKSGSSGEAVIQGVGTAWSITSSLNVGNKGDGTLDILDGATVSSRYGSIAADRGSSGQVTVQGVGSTWSNDYAIAIGSEGDGELIISDGAAVSSNGGYVGYRGRSSGRARVQGAGSTWTMLGDLYVGNEGDGELTISEGGRVSNASGYIGKKQGVSAQVAVEGAGSRWDLSGDLDIDYGGAHSLTISDGATVNVSGSTTVTHNPESPGAIHFSGGTLDTGDLIAAAMDLTGVGTINTSGQVKSDVDLVFDATSGLNQSVTLDHLPGQNVTINLTVDEADPLYAGYFGSGSITIADGFQLQSRSNSYVGYEEGSSGRVDVRGNGSTWNHYGRLYVGHDGDGSLTISNGASAAGGDVYIGNGKDSSGEVAIQGPSATWNVNNLRVGDNGDGILNITDGAVVTSRSASIRQESRVTVDGTGSAWNISNTLYVDPTRDGDLTISNGAKVSSHDGRISGGRVTLDGDGSRWDLSEDLEIRSPRDRALTITDGAVVNVAGSTTVTRPLATGGAIHFDGGTLTTHSLEAAATDLTGVGTINTGGLISDVDLVFDATRGLSQTIKLDELPGQDITVNFDFSRSGSIYVGYRGSGSMVIADGFELRSSRSYIGYAAGSTGTVTIQGVGTAWRTNDDLTVGFSGDGTLTVSGGATVSSYRGSIASTRDSSSRATIQGAGSEWSVSETLSVRGTLTISDGASVSSTYGSIDGINAAQVRVLGDDSAWNLTSGLTLGSQRHKSAVDTLTISDGASVNVAGATTVYSGEIRFDGGTLTTGSLDATNAALTGVGAINTGWLVRSDVDLVFDAAHGPTQTIKLDELPGQDITINLTVEEPGPIYAGYASSGSITIANGYDLMSTVGYLGHEPGSSGRAAVQGAGSSWSLAGSLVVGYQGVGSLTITEGASVSNHSASIGNRTTTTSRVTVDGAGSEWNTAYNLDVGRSGYGTLTISDGAAVNVAGSTTVSGPYAYEVSSIHFDGGTLTTGSLKAAAADLTGKGTINTGNLISDVDLVFSATRGLSQTVTLDGLPGQDVTVNLTVDESETLYTGYRGYGSTTITEGFRLSTRGGEIGYTNSASGQVTVQGAGSAWENSGRLYVGRNGDGSLIITDGASVDTSTTYVGRESESSGRVTVQGSGSALEVTHNLHVAYYGDGVLTITGNGSVSAAGGLSIGSGSLDSSGAIRMATGGTLALRGDADGSLDEFLGLIAGSDAIDYWDEDLGEWSALVNAAYGLDYTLEYLTRGHLAGYTVLTVGVAPDLPGDFNNDGQVDTADYTVWRDHVGAERVSLPNDTYRGEIGESQFALWVANYGKSLSDLTSTANAASPAVPETAGVSLALLGMGVVRVTRARGWTSLRFSANCK